MTGQVRVVTVSARSARQPFAGCEPEYIRDVCRGACCRRSAGPALVTIQPSEEAALAARGASCAGGRITPNADGRCPFQTDANLCGLHGTGDKPFGCVASPFTLAPGGRTLIVRNRYRLLRCFDDGPRVPAYRAFSASLVVIFGAAVAGEVTAHLDAGGGDYRAPMPEATWASMLALDAAKKGAVAGGWRQGTLE